MVKNPRAPRQDLTGEATDFISYSDVLWRIHRTIGVHRSRWDQLRAWGPVDSRWDPHPPPPGDQPDAAVLYASTDVPTAFGEVFQHRRAITLTDQLNLAGWIPVRPLRLLDLTGTWPVRNGASASLHAAPKATCRRWAQVIRSTWPDIDGLWVPSTITLRNMVVLFAPGADSFPSGPSLSRPINHPGLAALVVESAQQLGWPVRVRR
jgi:RES domain